MERRRGLGMSCWETGWWPYEGRRGRWEDEEERDQMLVVQLVVDTSAEMGGRRRSSYGGDMLDRRACACGLLHAASAFHAPPVQQRAARVDLSMPSSSALRCLTLRVASYSCSPSLLDRNAPPLPLSTRQALPSVAPFQANPRSLPTRLARHQHRHRVRHPHQADSP